jgi:hypothetical protein
MLLSKLLNWLKSNSTSLKWHLRDEIMKPNDHFFESFSIAYRTLHSLSTHSGIGNSVDVRPPPKNKVESMIDISINNQLSI